MKYEYKELRYLRNNLWGVLVGIWVGGLIGALAALLLAPQSGKDTRRQIREKGLELRDRTSEFVEETLDQVRTSTNKAATDLKKYGQKLEAEQLEDASEAIQARKKALQHS